MTHVQGICSPADAWRVSLELLTQTCTHQEDTPGGKGEDRSQGDGQEGETSWLETLASGRYSLLFSFLLLSPS